MRPTIEYVIKTFEKYNALCFGSSLPLPKIRLGLRYGAMGLTQCVTCPNGQRAISIEISIRLDLPEEEYIDTIVHEMIHYYIMYNNLQDSSPHGHIFRSKMEEIIRQTGIKITIKFNPDDEYLVSLVTHPRYICTVELPDNQIGVMVSAKNRIFAIWNYIESTGRKYQWYVSNRAIWGQFPTCVTPAYRVIAADVLHHYLTGALPLIRERDVIKVQK